MLWHFLVLVNMRVSFLISDLTYVAPLSQFYVSPAKGKVLPWLTMVLCVPQGVPRL